MRAPNRGARIRRGAIALVTATLVCTPSVARVEPLVGVNVEVYIAVDLTGSMAAEDYDGDHPRLVGVRADLEQLVEQLPGARYSVISYSSTTTRQLPLTTDSRAVIAWGQTARQELTDYSAGSAIDRPVDELERILADAQQENPHATRLLFLLTDGESSTRTQAEGDTKHPEEFARLASYISGGAVLGYGTTNGGKMREYDGTPATGAGTNGPYIIDKATGQPAISKLDDAALRTAADALAIPYVHREHPGTLDVQVDGMDLNELVEVSDRNITVQVPRYWGAPAILAVLIVAELFTLGRRLGELRRRKNRAGAR